MSRHKTTRKPKEPASIGDTHVQMAINWINRAFKSHAAMLQCPLNRDEMVRALYPPDVLCDAVRLKDWVTPKHAFELYHIFPHATLMITFDDSVWPTMREEAVDVQPAFTAVQHWFAQVQVLYAKYERVKHLLRKLNREATPGSVRYLWPAVMTLCPSSPVSTVDLPSRYTIPDFAGKYLEAIRETSATVAATTMMPTTALPNVDKGLCLTFGATDVSIDSLHVGPAFTSDTVAFNI